MMTQIEINTMHSIQNMASAVNNIDKTFTEILALLKGVAERDSKRKGVQETKDTMKKDASRLADALSAISRRTSVLLKH